MRIRYQSSILGVLWSLIHPLFHLLVFTCLFKIILQVQVDRFSSYAFIGILTYSWLHSSLSQAAACILHNRQLIVRPNAPTRLLPAASVGFNLVNLLIALPILIIFILIGGSQLGPSLLLLPLVVLVQGVFILACAYFVAAINVFMRDTEHALEVLLRLGYFLTPVFYGIDQIPERWRTYYSLNPMVHFLDFYRSVLIDGRIPSLIPMGALFMVSMVALIGGVFLFTRLQNRFVEDL